MENFKRVQKIFEAPIDTIISDLSSVPEDLREVVLMGINNKLEEQFAINHANLNHVIQWCLEAYKK